VPFRPQRPALHRRRLAVAIGVAVSLVVTSCGDATPAAEPTPTTTVAAPAGYEATIRWTAHGVAHVVADDPANLGFGQGWAVAEDRACVLADQIVKVRGQRARYHGAGEPTASGLGEHVASDVAYAVWDLRGRAASAWPTLTDDARALIEGYAAGYNAWLAERGPDAVPGWCSGAEWLGPIDALDLFAYHHDLAMVASGRNLRDAVAAAAPPAPDGTPAPGAPALPLLPSSGDAVNPALVGAEVGGVAWALGRAVTGADEAVLGSALAYPWDGELALWENHLTIPGTLDVYGFSLVGVPGIFSGFTEDLAWAQVPSAGSRFTYASVELAGGDATSYRVGSQVVSMDEVPVRVEVVADDGAIGAVERTGYTTQWGPVIAAGPLVWSDEVAFTYRDAAGARPQLVDQFWRLASAASLDEVEEALSTVAATPWTATVALTATGVATLIDASATPAVADAALLDALVRTAADPAAAAVAASGGVLLDASDPTHEWLNLDGAAAPGLVPADGLPRARATDWIVATGDNARYPNDTVVVEGVAALAGAAPRPLSVGARHALVSVAELIELAAVDGRDLGSADVRGVLLENRGLLSRLLLDEVVERCRAAGVTIVDGRSAPDGTRLWEPQLVPLEPTCNLLERWEGLWTLDDQATAVWAEFLAAYQPADLRTAGRLFAGDFDPADPLGTPVGLAPRPASGPDPVAVALGEATLAVGAAGFDIDDFWREVHWSLRGGERIPLGGSTGTDGTTTIGAWSGASTSLAPVVEVGALVDAASGLRAGGRPVNAGTGAVMVVAFTDAGVAAEALLASGQSGDPDSPFYADQAYRYSDRAWRPVRFDEDEVAAATERERVVQAPRLP
jgi:acyl-homoserine-lactone acylase